MVISSRPVLQSHHKPLDRAVLRSWGIPSPWTFGVGFQATFGDLDAQQHVSNVVYLRWIESFRVAYLRAYGWEEYATPGATPMVIRKYEIDYLRPCHLGDDIVVTGRTVSVRQSSCVMKYAIWRDGLVAEASCVLVFLDNDNLKGPIPAALRAEMMRADRAVSSAS